MLNIENNNSPIAFLLHANGIANISVNVCILKSKMQCKLKRKHSWLPHEKSNCICFITSWTEVKVNYSSFCRNFTRRTKVSETARDTGIGLVIFLLFYVTVMFTVMSYESTIIGFGIRRITFRIHEKSHTFWVFNPICFGRYSTFWLEITARTNCPI